MQAYSARPVLCRVCSSSTPGLFYTYTSYRPFHRSRCWLEDDTPNSSNASRQSSFSPPAQRSSQAAAQVQDLLNLRESQRRPSRAQSDQPPQPDGAQGPKPSGPVDLRSLGSAASPTRQPKPALRRSSARPAARSRGPASAGGKRRRDILADEDESLPTGGRGRISPTDELFDDDELLDGNGRAQAGMAEEHMSEEEREYVERRRRELEDFEKPKTWNPETITMEGLRKYIPRFPFGVEGNMKAVQDRMDHVADYEIIENTREYDLAERLRKGHYVSFRDEQEKGVVLAIARRLRGAEGSKAERLGRYEKRGRGMIFKPLSQESQNQLTGEIVEGKYQSFTERTEYPAADKFVHLLRQNHSYTKNDRASILDKLGQLLPSAPAATGVAPEKRVGKPAKRD